MFQIDLANPGDQPAIDALLDAAFGPGRAAKICYRYREGRSAVPGLSFVARDAGGGLVATIAHWSVTIGAPGRPALLLGPLAVAADRRGSGVGSAMMRHALAAAAEAGHRVVTLVGDAAYYRRFGFVAASDHGVAMPFENPARVQLLALADGALDGIGGVILPADAPAVPAPGRIRARGGDRWARRFA